MRETEGAIERRLLNAEFQNRETSKLTLPRLREDRAQGEGIFVSIILSLSSPASVSAKALARGKGTQEPGKNELVQYSLVLITNNARARATWVPFPSHCFAVLGRG